MSNAEMIPVYAENSHSLREEFEAIKQAYEKRLYEDDVLAEFDQLLRTNYNNSLEVFSQEILRKTAEFTGAFQGIFYVLNRNKQIITATASYVLDLDKLDKKIFGMYEGMIGEIVRSGKTKYFQNLPAGHTQLESGSISMSASEILMMPLIFSEIVFGVVELFFVEPLHPEKYELLKKLNHHISATLESVLNVLGTKELLTESLKQAQALAEARKTNEQIIQKYEQILQASSDPILITDEGGILQFFNTASERLWGYQNTEIIGKSVAQLVPLKHANRILQHPKNYKSLGTSLEVEALTKLKQKVPILVTITCVQLKTGTIFTIFAKDITIQKQREIEIQNKNSELAASEEELMQNLEEMETIQLTMKGTQNELLRQKSLIDALIEGNNTSIYAIDTNFRLLLWNTSSHEFYMTRGIELEAGISVLDLPEGNHRKALRQNLTKVLTEGIEIEIETTREYEGKQHYFIIFYFPIRDAEQQIIGAGISARDVTKQREEQLVMSQMSFVFSSARESVWIMKDERIINCNQASAELFGASDVSQLIGKKFDDFSPENQVTGMSETPSKFLIPLELQECLEKDTHLFEWQHQTIDNKLIECEVLLSKLEYNDEVLISAMHRNITERKKRQCELASQNRRITDSIRYAESIQKAILPKEESLASCFSSYFILYSPKDIVSGDFYWFTELDNKIFLTVADCTGHGVPGAFMSMIGISLLNQTIREQRIFEPAEILNTMNLKVAEALRQEEKANIDGMDMAFTVFEKKTEKDTWLTFCGAKRSLYYISEEEIHELKGTRKSVGGTQNSQVFENQSLVISKGTMIYFTTDGFVDQQGFNKRKFGSRRLKKLLLENAHLPLPDQQALLENAFIKHQGKHEQRDDVTILAVRL